MSGSKSKIILIFFVVFIILIAVLVWVLPKYQQFKEVQEARKQANDALGELTLNNLRARAEIFAFNKRFDVSYEGWCETLEPSLPGLNNTSCSDNDDFWALSTRTSGTGIQRCVDSENGVVNGKISTESGLCEQGEIQVVTTSSDSVENQVTTKSNLSAVEIERITNESIEKIREIADQLDGIELQIVNTIPNLKPGEAKEWRGITVEPVGDYPVIMISGTAATRADLAAGVQARGFLGELLTVPNFDPLLPTNVLTQANDIEFDMVVVVTGEQ
jgi:type II secretory pathway pseudopilin PulG